MPMHRQACLGLHCRIHALQRHHHLKANLPKVTLSEKVVQNHPFENNTTILDESNVFASSTYRKHDYIINYLLQSWNAFSCSRPHIKLVDELPDQSTGETYTYLPGCTQSTKQHVHAVIIPHHKSYICEIQQHLLLSTTSIHRWFMQNGQRQNKSYR